VLSLSINEGGVAAGQLQSSVVRAVSVSQGSGPALSAGHARAEDLRPTRPKAQRTRLIIFQMLWI